MPHVAASILIDLVRFLEALHNLTTYALCGWLDLDSFSSILRSVFLGLLPPFTDVCEVTALTLPGVLDVDAGGRSLPFPERHIMLELRPQPF